MEFEPGTPGSEITELPFQLSHKALDEFRWLKRLFYLLLRLSSELKTKMDRLYVLEDSVKSLFWKNSKPIRSCVLGSTSHRNLRALPSRSALGCASGTTLGQRAQVSMLGRTSDAASNINWENLQIAKHKSVQYAEWMKLISDSTQTQTQTHLFKQDYRKSITTYLSCAPVRRE